MSDNSNRIIESELDKRITQIEAVSEADFVAYLGPILDSTPDNFKSAIEATGTRHKTLLLLLETDGGYVEAAERIVNILRYHYEVVDFVVTSHAMSAGTVLAMSGDNIYMDYSAVLGPIDPQVGRPGAEGLIPALGYLEQYNRLIERSSRGVLTSAELAYLVERFDPAELYQYEQSRELSVELLKEWLVKYKFKNWSETETRKLPVTDEMRQDRAVEIARSLNATAEWHSHSRGISMEVARKDLNLQIDDIRENAKLHKSVADYETLLYDYRGRRGHFQFVHNWLGGYHGH